MGRTEFITDWPSYRITLIVLIVAFLALLPAWINYDIIAWDGAFQYIPVANLFLQGKFKAALSMSQLPLFPLLIAIVCKITSFDPEMSGRLISAICFVVAAVGIFKVGQVLFENRWVALLSALFLITNRQIVYRSVDCLIESLLLCFILWGNYFILKGLSFSHKAKYFFAGTILFLLGALVRSTSLFFLGVWIFLWVIHKKKGILARGFVLILPLAGFLSLWFINPDLTIFRKSFNLRLILHPLSDVSSLMKHSTNIIGNFFSKGNPFIILFGCAGLMCHKKANRSFWWNNLYYIHIGLTLGIFFIVLLMMGFMSDRYVLAPIAWVYPLAAYVIMQSMHSKNKKLKVLTILAIISCPLMWADKAFTPPDPYKVAVKDAGQWILSQRGPGAQVITNLDRLTFYAKSNYIPLEYLAQVVNAGKTFPDRKGTSFCIAIDITEEGGEYIKTLLGTLGVIPNKVFGVIEVYLL